MTTFRLLSGSFLIVLGLVQIVGTFWHPVSRYLVIHRQLAEISDQRKRQRVRLGWLAQAMAFILIGTTFILSRLLTDSTLLVIALLAAVLAHVPLIFRLIYAESW